MRLDKFLCEMNVGSRSQVKQLVKQGKIKVNGRIASTFDEKIDENYDTIEYMGNRLLYKKYRYFVFNKPAGCVTATTDKNTKTVMDFFPKELQSNFFPVGRLDKDTEGLLLITNDGDAAHYLISPKNHVDKTYIVDIKHSLSDEDIDKLCTGIDLGEDGITRPATVKIISDLQIELTIHEGKFHQVKRMLKAVGNEVIHLKRLSFATLTLPNNLGSGEYIELSDEEIEKLNER